MEVDLRDLEADRRLCETELPNISTAHYDSPSGICWSFANRSKEALAASLDEIERLKRLLVKPGCGGWFADCGRETIWFNTEADAWAAVRKAAMK